MHALKLDKIMVQFDAMIDVDCINEIYFSMPLDNIVVDCRLLLSSFKETYIMYLNMNLTGDAHHLVKRGNLVDSSFRLDVFQLNETLLCVMFLQSLISNEIYFLSKKPQAQTPTEPAGPHVILNIDDSLSICKISRSFGNTFII